MIVRSPGLGAIERRTAIQGMRRLALAAASRRRGMGQSDLPDIFTGNVPDTIDIPSLPAPAPIDLGPLPTPPINLPGGNIIPSLPIAPGSMISPTVGSSTWQQTLQNLLLGGEKIAATATMPAGSFTTTRYNPLTGQYETVTANAVPGAIPGGSIFGAAAGGASSLFPILLLGGGVLLVVMLAGKR